MNEKLVPSFILSATVAQNLAHKGYAVLNAELFSETADMLNYIEENYGNNLPYFNYSLLECDFEKSKNIRHFFSKKLRNFYQQHFTDYRTLNESFLSKPGLLNEEFLLHQDFNYTDEKKFPSYNIWIPLTDVNENNGAMFVLPGSHLWFNNYRSASLPTSRISMKNFHEHQIEKIPMKPGQVLLFNPAVFHGSFANKTTQSRIVVTATVTHANADFLYYHQQPKDSHVEVILLSEDAYLRELKQIASQQRPSGKLIQQFNYNHKIITETELLEKANQML